MHASRVLSVSVLSLALAGYVGAARAASTTSDRLLITTPTGVVLFDNSIPEAPATGTETSLTFTGGPAPAPEPIPLASALTLPGISIVALTEPAGAAPEPGETPLRIPGTNIFISDLAISTATVPASLGVLVYVSFFSDADPEFEQALPILATLIPSIHFLGETGQLQDVTSFLLPVPSSVSVLVQSEVVPEPAPLLLFGSALALLGLASARRQRA